MAAQRNFVKKFDVLIIGGGPGGYRSAQLLAEGGKTVALFEKNKLGGSCLQVGCIPTKLLQSAATRFHTFSKEGKAWGIEAENMRFNFQAIVDRTQKTLSVLERGIQSMLSNAKAEVFHGEAIIKAPNLVECNGEEYQGSHLILAVGSRPRQLSGFKVGGNVVTSDELLAQPRLPQSLLIVGAGVIGLEFACLYAQLGVKVRVGDVVPRILPNMDEEIGQLMLNSLRKLGVEVELGLQTVEMKNEELVLLAVGREPNSDRAGIPVLGLQTQGGKIETNRFLQTSLGHIYAIGDLTGKYPYAHTAYEHARIAAQKIINPNSTEVMDDTKVPHVIFTSPEIAAVGLSEAEAKNIFKNVKVYKNNFAANSKARILGEIQGWSKMVCDGDTGLILGAQLIGPEATDLIGEACVLVTQKITVDQLDRILHPHPTLNEIFANH
jgi:dihydrolipoamide dehydrogenase